ncbi:tRNA guanosine(34) transglycosylase Tgt [Rhabdothermincola salaria]|uniref:tRNA guanosine(34) transglycosylase Tgt n=1 Tax=Rhabdothermincola salaria TaxID=2903142 RepID=UPI001E4E49A9|nr:tRNA guanosine(34) transglycosylase Tgt [Rhabdothermincola salaria]
MTPSPSSAPFVPDPTGHVVRLDLQATHGPARAATVHTARGSFRTPCFMPVGTRAVVRALTAQDLEDLGAEVVLANTYHLMLRPGADLVAELGGLHRFSGWDGHVLTDSGGYQVFSLEPKVTDDGATFVSTYDGSRHHLTPESCVAIQQLLGADIQMVLDVCPPLPSADSVVRSAVDRSALWAGRARAAHRPAREEGSTQALFGIVQGGVDPALRTESAERTVALDFDGYGIGGLSVGESRDEMLPALAAALAGLPPDQPRYLMGVGDPVSLVEAVALGVDMFDCVLPTRLARHGTILTSEGRLNLRNLRWARDPSPLEEGCICPACVRHSKGYLRHLLLVNEPTAARLTSLHNVHWLLRLMERTRAAIVDGTLDTVRREVAEVWS